MKNIYVMGIVVEDPELIKTENENGEPQLSFMLSVRDKLFKHGKFELIEVYCRGRLIKTVQKHFKKGNTIIVNGHPLVALQSDFTPVQRIYAHNMELVTPYRSITVEFNE